MRELVNEFKAIVNDLKKKRHDLLAYENAQFDRDYLEFNANIHELESSLQGFINSTFEHIGSTEHALSQLTQLQKILKRESLTEERAVATPPQLSRETSAAASTRRRGEPVS